MLIRACLIAAIVTGLAVSVINLWKVREVIDYTRTELNTTSNTLVRTEGQLRDTRRELTSTQEELDSTKTTLTATTQERDRLRSQNDQFVKQNATLTKNLKTTTEQRDAAQAELAAWHALGITVDQVKAVIAALDAAKESLAVARDENRLLTRELEKTKVQLMKFVSPDTYKVPLPPGLKGVVLVADPKWDFVVLDIGEDNGVLEDGELLVNRDGRLVAKVRVRSVQKDRCIANVVPGWKLGQVMEGDQVIPAL